MAEDLHQHYGILNQVSDEDLDLDEKRLLRLPQTIGCLTLLAALMIAGGIVCCQKAFEKDDKPKQPKTEQNEEKQLPKKITSFIQDSSFTYTQKLRERGE